jgi:hypothetical protein
LRFQGKLTNWNDNKGYGFVDPKGGGDRCFVHIKSFQRTSRRVVDCDLINRTIHNVKDLAPSDGI